MRVVVTRPEVRAAELAERLAALGHQVESCPLVRTDPIGPGRVDLAAYDWVVLTSRTAVTELAGRAVGAWPRVAAVGPGTAQELRARGIEPAVVASVSTQEGLLAALPRPAGRVLFAGAEDARPLLARELAADVVSLYRTVRLRPARFPTADLVVLASASAARAYGELGACAPAVSIGPQTTAAAQAAGVTVVAEAPTHDVDGLVTAVQRASLPPR